MKHHINIVTATLLASLSFSLSPAYAVPITTDDIANEAITEEKLSQSLQDTINKLVADVAALAEPANFTIASVNGTYKVFAMHGGGIYGEPNYTANISGSERLEISFDGSGSCTITPKNEDFFEIGSSVGWFDPDGDGPEFGYSVLDTTISPATGLEPQELCTYTINNNAKVKVFPQEGGFFIIQMNPGLSMGAGTSSDSGPVDGGGPGTYKETALYIVVKKSGVN